MNKGQSFFFFLLRFSMTHLGHDFQKHPCFRASYINSLNTSFIWPFFPPPTSRISLIRKMNTRQGAEMQKVFLCFFSVFSFQLSNANIVCGNPPSFVHTTATPNKSNIMERFTQFVSSKEIETGR